MVAELPVVIQRKPYTARYIDIAVAASYLFV